MIYILLLLTYAHGGGAVFSSQEFNDQASCLTAKTFIEGSGAKTVSSSGKLSYAVATCLPKGPAP